MDELLSRDWMDPIVHEPLYTHREAIWVAELDNGEIIYQDDYRPEFDQQDVTNKAWNRLKRYCLSKNLKIVDMYLKFWDNEVRPLPRNCSCYYFKRRFGGVAGGFQQKYMILGFYQEDLDRFKIFCYTIPELQLFEVEEREPKQDDQGPNLPIEIYRRRTN